MRLQLRASEPHIAFQQYAGSASSRGLGYSSDGLATYQGRFEAYDAICIAPCTARLPRGTLRLGLAKRNRETAEADPIQITESGTLVGTYTDRQGVRTAGWILGIGSGLVGLGLITAGILDAQDTQTGNVIVEDAEPNYVLLGTGLGVGVVGSLVGFILTQMGDQAEIRYRRLGRSRLPAQPNARATKSVATRTVRHEPQRQTRPPSSWVRSIHSPHPACSGPSTGARFPGDGRGRVVPP